MKCNNDCLNCTLSECVKDINAREVHKRYYERNREKIIARVQEWNKNHKDRRHEASKKRWENMSEEKKESERARQREYHRRKKETE